MRLLKVLLIVAAVGCTQAAPTVPERDPALDAQEKYSREADLLRGLEDERRRLNTDRSFHAESARLLQGIIDTSAPIGRQVDPQDVRDLDAARKALAELDAQDRTLLKQIKSQEKKLAEAKAALELPQ